jgi:hypothetical protein
VDGVLLGAQPHPFHADAFAYLCPLLLGGHAAAPPVEPPRLDEGPDRDIEGPVGFLAEPGGQREQLKQPRLDRHTGRGRVAIQRTDFAGVAVNGQLRFQAINLVERGLGGFHGAGGAVGEDDLKGGRHGPAAEAKQRDILCSRLLRRKRTGFIESAEHLAGGLREAAGVEEVAAVHGRSQRSEVRAQRSEVSGKTVARVGQPPHPGH